MLKDGKSPGVDSIPAEIQKYGGPRHHRYLNHRMSENLDQWTVAQRLDKVTDYSSSEEKEHTTLSELQTDQPDLSLKRLVNQAEQILEEKQAGFRSQRNSTEQIFNLRLLVEKHLEHLKELLS